MITLTVITLRGFNYIFIFSVRDERGLRDGDQLRRQLRAGQETIGCHVRESLQSLNEIK